MSDQANINLLPEEFSVGPNIITLSPEQTGGTRSVQLLVYGFDDRPWTDQLQDFSNKLTTKPTVDVMFADFAKASFVNVGQMFSAASQALLDQRFVKSQRSLTGQVVLLPPGEGASFIRIMAKTFANLSQKPVVIETELISAVNQLSILIKRAANPEA